MSHPRFRLVLVGLVPGLVTASTVSAAQAHSNDTAAPIAHPASLQTYG